MFGWIVDRIAHHSSKRSQAILSLLSVRELGSEAADVVAMHRWDRFDAGSRLASAPESAADLLYALNELHRALWQDDLPTGVGGRDGRSFEFHDSGLLLIAEEAERRSRGVP